MTALKIDIDNCRYKAMFGVGGVGSGSFFRLNKNHTLGREESRFGYYVDQKDYCKLHIISHYVQTLLGFDFSVFPIGKVGNDEIGTGLLKEMRDVGMKMDYMEQSAKYKTLFAFCFIYPDGSGGNMSENDSASSKVDVHFIEKAYAEFERFNGRGMVLAAPEVPMETRAKLLEIGTLYNFFCIASFNSEEIPDVMNSGMLKNIDLIALNLDEAAAVLNKTTEGSDVKSIIEASIKDLAAINPNLLISITNGKNGSWSWDGKSLIHIPVHHVHAKGTAGAGDAHLAGIIVGLTAGLSLQEAQRLGTLISCHAVTSPHAINKQTNRRSLKTLAEKSKNNLSENICKLLKE